MPAPQATCFGSSPPPIPTATATLLTRRWRASACCTNPSTRGRSLRCLSALTYDTPALSPLVLITVRNLCGFVRMMLLLSSSCHFVHRVVDASLWSAAYERNAARRAKHEACEACATSGSPSLRMLAMHCETQYSAPALQVLPSFMLEEITFGAAQRVKLVQRIMMALAKCVAHWDITCSCSRTARCLSLSIPTALTLPEATALVLPSAFHAAAGVMVLHPSTLTASNHEAAQSKEDQAERTDDATTEHRRHRVQAFILLSVLCWSLT